MYFCSFNSNCYNSVLQMYKSRVFIGRHNSALPVTAAVISAIPDINTPATAITILAYLRYAAILRRSICPVWLLYFIYQEIQYKSASSVRNVPFCCVFKWRCAHLVENGGAYMCVHKPILYDSLYLRCLTWTAKSSIIYRYKSARLMLKGGARW